MTAYGRELLAEFAGRLAGEVRANRVEPWYGSPPAGVSTRRRTGARRGMPPELHAALYGPRTVTAAFVPTVSRTPGRSSPRSTPRRPGTRRHRPRFGAPVPLLVATSGLVDGERLDMDGLVEPAGPTPLKWCHRGGPIGVVDVLEVGDFDLTATIRFNLSTSRGAECQRARDRGETLHASAGFTYDVRDLDEWGVVRHWSLCDVSVVPAGRSADPAARTPPWRLPPRVVAAA